MNRSVVLTLLIITASLRLAAQEQLGIRTSNYAGVNGLTLNPAGSLTSPFRWDVNLVEFSQFFENNFLFVENFRLLDVLRMPTDFALRPDLIERNRPAPSNALIVDFYRRKEGTFYGDFSLNIMGPSFMLRLGDWTTVGLYTRARTALNARDVPGNLGYYEYAEQEFGIPLNVDPFKISAMAWSEIGLNYARSSETAYGDLSIGGTLKFLQGYEGAYVRNEEPIHITQLRGSRLAGTPGRFLYGHASSITEDTVWQLRRHGVGAAIDVGVTFTILDEEEDGYKWKFGFSLLDVGAITFNRAAEQHDVRISDSLTIDLKAYEDFTSTNQVDSILEVFSRQILKDPTASLVSRKFGMWLPTALSAQAEVAITPFLFVNASLIQGIPLSNKAILRNSIAAITPRFESRWIEVALPISMLNWQQFRTGAAVRLGYFWFGTDDLGSVFKKSNFDSSDIYFAVKINPFQLNLNKVDKSRTGWQGPKRPKIKAKSRKGIGCPAF